MGAACGKNNNKPGSSSVWDKLIAEAEGKFKKDLAELETATNAKKAELHEALLQDESKRSMKAERDLICQLYQNGEIIHRINIGITTCKNLSSLSEDLKPHPKMKKTEIPEQLKHPIEEILATIEVLEQNDAEKYQPFKRKFENLITKAYGVKTLYNLKIFSLVAERFKPRNLKRTKLSEDQIDYQLFQFCVTEKIHDFAMVDKVGHHVVSHAGGENAIDAAKMLTLGGQGDENSMGADLNRVGSQSETKPKDQGEHTPKLSVLEIQNSMKVTARFSDKKNARGEEDEEKSKSAEKKSDSNIGSHNRLQVDPLELNNANRISFGMAVDVRADMNRQQQQLSGSTVEEDGDDGHDVDEGPIVIEKIASKNFGITEGKPQFKVHTHGTVMKSQLSNVSQV